MNTGINILEENKDYVVCLKPSGVVSEDTAGGMPERLKKELGYSGDIYAVHRLDKATSGLMVYAKTKEAAAGLAKEIQNGNFRKEYLAVIHGCPKEDSGTFRDFLFHDTRTNKSYVVKTERKGTKEAVLDYDVLGKSDDLALVKVRLYTGRTHQIRVQFASRKMPVYGDSRYGAEEKAQLALWSYRLSFFEREFSEYPEPHMPWKCFNMVEEI